MNWRSRSGQNMGHVGKNEVSMSNPTARRAVHRRHRRTMQDGQSMISLRHSVNGDFCGHSRFVLWHENLTTFVS